MPNIGKVTISSNNIRNRVTVKQQIQTTIANPNFQPEINLAVGDLSDVVDNNVQDGFTLIYNSVTQKYETKAVSLENLDRVAGGTF